MYPGFTAGTCSKQEARTLLPSEPATHYTCAGRSGKQSRAAMTIREVELREHGMCRDTPDPYSGGKKNYVIEAPGRYHLKSGRLQQLS